MILVKLRFAICIRYCIGYGASLIKSIYIYISINIANYMPIIVNCFNQGRIGISWKSLFFYCQHIDSSMLFLIKKRQYIDAIITTLVTQVITII